LTSYFDIARKNVQDSVTKAIWHFLVNRGREDLHRALVTGIYQEQDLDKLLVESEATKSRRQQLQTELAALRQAKEIIQQSEGVSLI
jgi:dynamin 1-like protein